MIKLSTQEFLKFIPGYILDISEKLQESGFHAYLVGGSIRDILLEKQPDDFDIATNAYPEEIMKVFPKSIPTGAKFGTITVIAEDEHGEKFEVQITTYRSEADYIGGRWPSKVEFSREIEDDLSRRDFTINALALNLQRFDEKNVPVEDLVIDLFGGLMDLNRGKIRAVRDPYERFSEDGLRAVRACRLASQLNFKIEPKTFNAIKQTLHITKLVSVERFRDELMKILLKSPRPSKGLLLLKESGILQLFIPELLEGINIVQPQFHADDVFTHLLKTVDAAEDDIKLAALFHDIAKPRTKSEDEKGVHFYGHDVKGAELTKEIMKRLKFSNAEIEKTSNLVRWHMFYYPSADWRKSNSERSVEDTLNSKKLMTEIKNENLKEQNPQTTSHKSEDFGWTDGAIRRFIKNVGGEDAVDDLMKLRIADAAGNPKSDFNAKELDALALRIADVRSKEMALKITDLDITGHDLKDNFDLDGKKLGEVLKYLLDKVIEDPALNKKVDLLRLSSDFLQNEESVLN